MPNTDESIERMRNALNCLDAMPLADIPTLRQEREYNSIMDKMRQYLSLHCLHDYIEDMIVKTSHEEGTIQSFYNIDKIESLIKNISFKIADIRKVTETSEIIDYINVRYFVVLERK